MVFIRLTFANMRTQWILLFGISIFSLFPAEATYRYSLTCQCHGRSHYCTVDSQGLRCLYCQDNTEGRHCERCKEGFYHQRAGERCQACNCNPTGSVSSACDSQGRCSCKPGIQGDKCDLCPNGAPLTQSNCAGSCRLLNNAGQRINDQSACLPCFCHGHSTECTVAEGYSIQNITSTFDNGAEGWRVAAASGVAPSKVRFHWSTTHRDLEVISEDSMPVYLSAPAAFLGDQQQSYGQSLSFSLRLDRGVRRPSKSDVVLEGAGLRVSAPLGDLRTVLPCGQRTTYSFRLTEEPNNKWQPQLTSLQFQKLLQNLTAIKIRGTFGENGRGYLDNVYLTSARLGPGHPAGWVEKCSCPTGYEGQFCERCAHGHKRRNPADGPLSPCEPCSCHGGSCDPDTGDCLSGDETPATTTCPSGYYIHPSQPRSCQKCPCPQGGACSVMPWTLEVKCDRCPPGVTGPQCNLCEDGFYGDPLGESGPPRPCQRCRCSGHIDPNAVGNCDRVTGECLKCLNHSRGFFCEQCEDGFHHSHPTETCKACNCNPLGSMSRKCRGNGQCSCKEGFEGLKCEQSSCPACFDQVKNKIERYLSKLREMESLLSNIESGSVPVNDAQMERKLGEAEALVKTMLKNSQQLSGMEAGLQSRLQRINSAHAVEARDLQSVSQTVDSIRQQDQSYQRKIADIQLILSNIRHQLETAKREINQAEFPMGDANGDSNILSNLALKATELADKHQMEAKTVEEMAKHALSEAEKGLVLMRSVITGENKVTELVNDLRAKFDKTSGRVKALEGQASRLSSSAEEESKVAEDALRQISALEKEIPDPLQTEIAGVAATLEDLRGKLTGNLTEYEGVLSYFQGERAGLEDLLAKGQSAQQKHDQLLAKVNGIKKDAEESLKDIVGNLDEVDEVLNKLKGFDEQITTNKAKAEEAIKKLPSINATIQQAVRSNSHTLQLLDNADGDYNDAMETASKVEDALAGMQGAPDTLTASVNLLRDSTGLTDDLKSLQSQATATTAKLETERSFADQQNKRAKEASAAATGAHNNAKKAKDAVGDTLLAINDLLSLLGQPGSVDEDRLAKMEGSVANVQSMMPELKDNVERLEEMGARQKEQLSSMDNDINNILKDIRNLEEIRKTIPKGCFNLGPIERP